MFEVLSEIGQIVGYVFLVLLFLTIVVSLCIKYEHSGIEEHDSLEQIRSLASPVTSPKNISNLAGNWEIGTSPSSVKPLQPLFNEKCGLVKQESTIPSVMWSGIVPKDGLPACDYMISSPGDSTPHLLKNIDAGDMLLD